MRYSRSSRNSSGVGYWPGFVDAISGLLLVFVFLTSVFLLAQFFLSKEILGRDNELGLLRLRISQLTEVLSLEKLKGEEAVKDIKKLQSSINLLGTKLEETKKENVGLRDILKEFSPEEKAKLISDLANSKKREYQLLGKLENANLKNKKSIDEFSKLNYQLNQLRLQILSLQSALSTSESKYKDAKIKINDLGSRLNVALAKKVSELEKYKSKFLAEISNVLKDRNDIIINGDRFTFQSEVLFNVGSNSVNVAGSEQLKKIASVIIALTDKIPESINWVVRIDGHTDSRPISNSQFVSNWELSVSRAISVVKILIDNGVPPKRLAAAGFGEFNPIASGNSPEDLAKNRRIEIRLTVR